MSEGEGSEYSGGYSAGRELPWYKDRAASPPFKLSRRISLNSSADFQAVCPFPWDPESLKKFWFGAMHTDDNSRAWRNIITEYWDAVAVSSDHNVYILFAHQNKAPISIKFHPKLDETNAHVPLLKADKNCIAWAMQKNFLEPLLIISRGSIVYIYGLFRQGVVGQLRGHGGAITSISVHPSSPNWFATTSRDFTTRIYDLNGNAQYTKYEVEAVIPPTMKKHTIPIPNPNWPPNQRPSFAGAAHGLRLPPNEGEGTGIGRCICVLMGGKSSGHQAAVLCSAFHPALPLIATGGMDRTVKIWPIRPTYDARLKREDKPLFSSGRLHKARVHSISWLDGHDVLLTHSAPAIMRVDPNGGKNAPCFTEPGELIAWRWLGLDRFFPVGWEAHKEEHVKNLRGCSSDYQESTSFKIISIHSFEDVPDLTQYKVANLSFYRNETHEPLVLFVHPGDTSISLFNACHMAPRQPPPFPSAIKEKLREVGRSNHDDGGLSDAAQKMDLNQGVELTPEEQLREHRRQVDGLQQDDIEQEEEEELEEDSDQDRRNNRINWGQRPKIVTPGIDGWTLSTNETDAERTLTCCTMSVDGRLIAAAGTKGTLWIWKLQVQET
ncbi:hypothetical protein D9613_001752 [Agrocybe pediades]|uniref:WD40 repeat-like protein n=1 Tax=Agrocybe pediades TaxID=84607 RepID=A0A8H4VX41_9AGAR|nr:hypothetical protein D9613_001752 [Agrocybe pediades]